MRDDLRDFLMDITRYAENVKRLVSINTLAELSEEFSSDGLALERCMEVIGEAVKHIPQNVRDQYPEVPWKKIAGLRDVLIHRYWSAQMARLVDIVENYLPGLEQVVNKILKDLNPAQ